VNASLLLKSVQVETNLLSIEDHQTIFSRFIRSIRLQLCFRTVACFVSIDTGLIMNNTNKMNNSCTKPGNESQRSGL